MQTVLLLGRGACAQADRLRSALRTPWQVTLLPDDRDAAAVHAALARADALVSSRWRAEWSGAATRLRLIQATGAGLDEFATDAIPTGCTLCNVFEHATPIAEYVLGALVVLTARLVHRDRLLRQGIWEGSARVGGEPHGELAGRTLGLLGYGTIGREIARRAAAFGMRIQALREHPQSPPPEPLAWCGGPEQLRELLSACEYLVICCPLTPRTRGWLDATRLGWLRPGSYLVNVSRAEIVEEAALFAALRSGWLAGAALDVWYRYPSPEQPRKSPAHAPFHQLENVLMTPHLSAWTHGLLERRWARIAANLDALAKARPLQNVVRGNPQPLP